MRTDSAVSSHEPRRMALPLGETALLWIILGSYFLLGLWYSVAVPAFETPDEIYHYAFARHLAQGNPLPVQSDEATGPWQQEGSQAPLYYLLNGLLTAIVDQSDFDEIAVFNPRANMGNPLFPGNKNRMLYSGPARPLQGANLALHLGRWFSLILGGITLWLVYRTAKLAFPRGSPLPLMAVVLIATMPQFLFVSASFTNDNMVVTASAAVVFWLARLLTLSRTRPIRLWEWVILGVLLGIAALSKLQGLGLFVLAGGAGLATAWQRRSWRTLFVAALGVAIPALLIAGWWYWRNYTLYGDWTGVKHLVSINGLRQKPLDLDDFWLEFRGLRFSFWGLFGWFNILLPSWFYVIMDLLTVLSLAGAVAGSVAAWRRLRGEWLRRSETQVRLLLLAWIGLSAALLLYWMIRATGSQGRLIFPALGAIAIWFVIGLDFWFARLAPPWRGFAGGAVPALLLAISLYGVTVSIPAAYAAPPPVSEIPPNAQPVGIKFGDTEPITLMAVDTPVRRYHPGENVPVTLYLSAANAISDDYELFVQLLDEQGTVLGNITSHPGWGRNPTSLWQPDAIYADDYLVPISAPIDPRSPLLARLYVGFIDPDTQPDLNHPVTARDAEGTEITPLLADIPIIPRTSPELAEYGLQPLEIEFGNAIELSGAGMPPSVTAGKALTATLAWIASGTPDADYTAFLHLLDSEGRFVAGHDSAPANGRFPTRYWQEGDRIVGELGLEVPDDLAPGDYEVWAGLYAAESQGQERLPVTRAGDRTVQNDMVNIGIVSVEGK